MLRRSTGGRMMLLLLLPLSFSSLFGQTPPDTTWMSLPLTHSTLQGILLEVRSEQQSHRIFFAFCVFARFLFLTFQI